MKLLIELHAAKRAIDLDYQPYLVGTLHKWFDNPELHDGISLYSFSRIMGSRVASGKLRFTRDPYFYFAAWDDNLIKALIRGITKEPTMFEGLEVTNIIVIEEPDFSNKNVFNTLTPIYCCRSYDDDSVERGFRKQSYTFFDKDCEQYLTETLQRKLGVAGIDESVQVRFDKKYPRPQIRAMKYKTCTYTGSMCPIIVEGSELVKKFAWNVGIGNSTGIGYGFID